MESKSFDVIVIGAGPAGEVAAGEIAQRDLRVAIVEDRLVGGECSYWACMPSKALLRPAQALDETRRVPGAAQAAGGELDVAAALARRDEVIHDLKDDAQLPWLEDRGIELFRGHGRLDGERRVRVGDDGPLLEARVAVVLAPGTVPALPPIDGLEDAAPWTNREATTVSRAPRRLIVLGGGPVGCELAQAWASLGSEVVLIEVADRLLAREEEYASQALLEALQDGGIVVRTGVSVDTVERNGATVRLTTAAGEHFEADELLVAAGRRAQTFDLGLETIDGLDLEPGKPIAVGDDLSVPGAAWLRVVGDANGEALLTHAGKAQARRLAKLLAGDPPDPLAPSVAGPRSPRVTFTEPQVAAVGHTEASAREAGLQAKVGDADASATAGASFHGKGLAARCRFVFDADRDVLIGATFTGADIAEMLHAATVAVAAELTRTQLRAAIPPFPTRSEVWLALLEG